MRLKRYDKIVCKKDYFGNDNILRKKPFFSVGESYLIRHIVDNEITIFFKYGNGWATFYIEEIKWNNRSYANLYDYFYTERELRKFKLNEIEGRR